MDGKGGEVRGGPVGAGLGLFKPKPREEIVEELEHLLEMARTGELTGLTTLAELTGARIHTFHSATDSVQSLGHLARMMATTNTALDDVVEPRTGSR